MPTNQARAHPPTIHAALAEKHCQPDAVLEHIDEGADIIVGMFNSEPLTVLDALEANGLSPEDVVYRHRTEDEVLPWAHLSAGLHQDFLWQDWRDALAEVGLPDCRWTPCYDCGACTGYGIEHVVASATPPAGGSQGTGQDLSTGGLGGPVPVTLSPRPRSLAGARP